LRFNKLLDFTFLKYKDTTFALNIDWSLCKKVVEMVAE